MEDDAKWQAESDARTLAEAKRIVSDKGRLGAAQAAAKAMLEKQEAETKALRSIANSANPTRIPSESSAGGEGTKAGFKKATIPDSMASVPLTMLKSTK